MEREVWAKAPHASVVKQARNHARAVNRKEGELRRVMGPQATRRVPVDSGSDEFVSPGKGEES